MTEVPEKPPEQVPTSPQDPEVALSSLMRDYKANSEAKAVALADIQKEMDTLASHMNVLALPFEVTQKDLYGKIEAIALDRGEKLLEVDEKAKTAFICESGKITYFREGIKRSWNLDALDSACEYDPYVKQMIWAHRNEAPILPRIQIKVE